MSQIQPLLGRDVVSRVERLVRHQSRVAQMESYRESMRQLQEKLDENGVRLDARGLVEDLERVKRTFARESVEAFFYGQLDKYVHDAKDPRLISINLPEVSDSLAEIYNKARWGNGSKKVLSSQIASALRCFKSRYIHSWQEVYGASFDADSFLGDVLALADKQIINSGELENWAEETYKLSNRFGVDRDDLLERMKTARSSRPIGIISQGSEGPYGRQWIAWIRSNAEVLLSPDFDEQPAGRHFVGTDYIWRKQVSTSHSSNSALLQSPSQVQQPARNNYEKLSIALSASNDESLVAKSQWSTFEEGASAAAKWISLIGTMWKGRAEKVLAKLNYESERQNFVVDLPENSFDELQKNLPEALKSISEFTSNQS